jgi:protein kinase-like protein
LSGFPPSSTPPERDAALDTAAAEVGRVAEGRFDVLGPLGRDMQECYAFLARPARGGERLVVLKAVAADPFLPPELAVIEELDQSVPPPAGSCAVCQTPFRSWARSCPDCGTDLAGAPLDSREALTRLRSAVRTAASGYEVLGDMQRADGGGVVFFARELPAGQIVALRLDQQEASGERPRYTVAATRMMRPKMMYGAVGGDTAGRAEPWAHPPTPAPTPQAGYGSKVCPQCGDSFEGDIRFCPRDGASLRVGSAEGLIGQVIADRYRIMEKLGEGGMGRVYLAEHIHMGRRCAVKVMSPTLLHDPDSISRFAREAANASRINHPNVAAIYDYGQTPDRIVYLAMELVEGGSLAQILERERGLQAARAVDIAQQTADALTAAHELGIVHRDLKPDNIMLARGRTGNDRVKVVDFGIAKAKKGGNQTVTRTGFVVGTPAYMSPEQILGDELDGRSDVYSLGCILFEMLTGQRAFAGPSGEVVIRKRLTENPPPPSDLRGDIGGNLDGIVIRAMARSPEHRFGSAAELREALEAVASESSSQTWWRALGPGRPAAETAGAPPAAGTRSSGRAFGTVPVPLGWEGAVAPPPDAGPRATVLRHRSTRTDTRPLLWAIGGGLLAILAGVGGWLAFRPAGESDRSAGLTAAAPAVRPPGANPGADGVQPRPDSTAASPNAASGTPSSVAPSAVSAPPAAADSATLYFASALPPDARLSLDGKARTVPPDGRLTVTPGTHTITVRAPGYRAGSLRVGVAAGETRELPLTLAPERSGPAAASAPAPVPEPTSTSGSVAESAPPATPPLSAPPAPEGAEPGVIVVSGTLPPSAVLRVDGKPFPLGSRTATVPPGEHSVTLSAPGYPGDSTRLEVAPAQRAQWLVTYNGPGGQPDPAEPPPPKADSQAAPKVLAQPPKMPAQPAVRPGAAPATAAKPTPPSGASGEAATDAGARALIQAYVKAINARDMKQLHALYPGMPPDQERQWRDLFRDEVKELSAVVEDVRVVPGGTPQANFTLALTFRPPGSKPQTFRLNNHAALRPAGGGWQFERLDQKGQ